jgi:guanine nucleotide-binding protein subunit beta-2-like 1 protein
VTSLSYGKNDKGSFLVSGGRDKSVICWNLSIDAPEEKVVDGNTDYKVGKAYKALKGHSHFVSSVQVSKDGKHAISGSWDKTIRLWDLNTFTCKRIFIGHTKDILKVTFSQDERMILSSGMDKTLRIWNALGENKYTVEDFNGWASSLHFIRQGKNSLLAVGSWDNKVRIFDGDYKTVRAISELDYGVVAMDSDPEGEFLFVAQKDGQVKIWGLSKLDNEPDTLKQTSEVNADIYDISYEDKFFNCVTLATSKGLSIRTVKENREIYGAKDYKKEWGLCLSLTWDEKREHLFAGFSDGYIRVFKVNNSN